MNIKHDKFSELYTKLKQQNLKLSVINSNTLNFFDKKIEKDQIDKDAKEYIVIVITATLVFLFYPIIIYKAYNSIDLVVHYLLISFNKLMLNNQKVIAISCGLSGFALLCYTYLFTYGKNILSKFSIFNTIVDIDAPKIKYKTFLIISTYISFGLTVSCIYTFYQNSTIIFTVIFKFYLLIPVLLLLLFGLMVVLLIIFSWPLISITTAYKYSENIYLEITYELLNVVNGLSKYKSIHLIGKKNLSTFVFKLQYISDLIKYLPNSKINSLKSTEIELKYQNASQEFRKIIDEFLIPNKNSKNLIMNKLINYFNLFITGNIKSLPISKKTNTIVKRKRFNVFINYAFIAIYFLIPILLLIIINSLSIITLDEMTKTILKFSYIVWVIIGIISNPFLFTEEVKDLLSEIIMTLLKKNK